VSNERDYNLSEVAVNEYLVLTAHHSLERLPSLTRFSRCLKSQVLFLAGRANKNTSRPAPFVSVEERERVSLKFARRLRGSRIHFHQPENYERDD
jgi:hypothetical protein